MSVAPVESQAADPEGSKRLENLLSQHPMVFVKDQSRTGCCRYIYEYGIYSDKACSAEKELLVANERSSQCMRACWKPQHSFIIDIREKRDQEPIYTFERPGLCCAKPLVACFGFTTDCTEEAYMYAGKVNPRLSAGAIHKSPDHSPIFNMHQRSCSASMCHPYIDVYRGATPEESSNAPQFYVTGPCCWGGLSEICCTTTFAARDGNNEVVGKIAKVMDNPCREIFTSQDKFKVEFGEKMQAQDKSAFMAVSFLADKMFFDSSNNPGMCICKYNPPAMSCVCCNTYCCGQIVYWKTGYIGL